MRIHPAVKTGQRIRLRRPHHASATGNRRRVKQYNPHAGRRTASERQRQHEARNHRHTDTHQPAHAETVKHLARHRRQHTRHKARRQQCERRLQRSETKRTLHEQRQQNIHRKDRHQRGDHQQHTQHKRAVAKRLQIQERLRNTTLAQHENNKRHHADNQRDNSGNQLTGEHRRHAVQQADQTDGGEHHRQRIHMRVRQLRDITDPQDRTHQADRGQGGEREKQRMPRAMRQQRACHNRAERRAKRGHRADDAHVNADLVLRRDSERQIHTDRHDHTGAKRLHDARHNQNREIRCDSADNAHVR